MTTLAIHTNDKLEPDVWDIFQEFLPHFPEIDGAELWSHTTPVDTPCLVLGHLPEANIPLRYVRTLSQKQILTNPAAVTELSAALTNLLTPPSFKPMKFEMFDSADSNPRKFLAQFERSGVVVVDIETGGDGDIMLPEETWLLSVAITDGKSVIVLSEGWLTIGSNRHQLARFLTSGVKLIAHNMQFDFRTLTAQLSVPIYGHLDPMLLHHSINPGAKEHGLKPLSMKYLGAPDWDAAIKEYTKGFYKERPAGYPEELWDKYMAKVGKIAVGYENIPRELLYEYNAYDVYWTWHLYEYLAAAVKNDKRLKEVALFEYTAANMFQDISSNGVAVDLEYLNELREKYEKEEVEVWAALREVTGDEKFNPNSPQQVKKFYAELDIPVRDTSVDTLEELSLADGSVGQRFTDLLLLARRVTKMKGTYVNGIIKRTHDGLVHPDFLVHGTNTGRLSSRDPNIQNIPRDEEGQVSLRRIFVPRDVQSRSLVSVDYSQAELRVMACLSNDEHLMSLFQPGGDDFFDAMMPSAFPNTDLAALDKATKKNLRAKLKGVVYGLAYNRKAAAIAKALDMSVKEAQAIINNFMRAAPQYAEWRKWVEEVAQSEDEVLETPFGRYYQSELVLHRSRQNIINAGLAFLPQSTASDLCVSAAVKVHRRLKAGEFGDTKIVATIHDAILLDTPNDWVEAVSAMVQYEMEESGKRIFGTKVQFATDATVGTSWYGI